VTAGTVLVLGDSAHASLVEQFVRGDVAVVLISPDPEAPGTDSARTCAEITRLDPTGPITVIAFGEAALLLPPVALAQRSAHRRVVEYVLVDPAVPPVSDSWPDAPVTVFCEVTDPTSIQGRLRGWLVRSIDDLGDWLPVE
jgi:hypothetical protein